MVVKQWIGRTYLRAAGWTVKGERPQPRQYVLIAAPHTSNWDLPFTLALSFYFDVPIRWAGKHTLFKPPFGWFLKQLGGIPIVRHKRGNTVKALAQLFEQHPNLVLTMPAEGTRSRVEHWKSGFYHIAREAHVPIVCGFLDYGRKEGGFGLTLEPTGEMHKDMLVIAEFYSDKQGLYPEKFGPVRFREDNAERRDPEEPAKTNHKDG
ncbi:MAG TPA: acyltransferase [Polyangiaceae bacterium]|nr:acyltransferase [Polyangiaceae bacterium]